MQTMPRFRIEGPAAVAGVFDADNWMTALGDALARMGVGADMPGLECEVLDDGDIRVATPGWQFTIHEQQDTVARVAIDVPEPVRAVMAAMIAVPTRSPVETAPRSPIEDTCDEISDFDAPEPSSSRAFRAMEERADDVLAEIESRATAITTAETADDACNHALDLLMQFVPAESGAVLLMDAATHELRFTTARGPRSRALRGLAIPKGKGIAGLVAGRNVAVTVREARTDARHYAEVDRTVGYTTRALLCVPVRGSAGTLGVLQLLNPFAGAEFLGWHQTAAQLVAAHLAASLGSRP